MFIGRINSFTRPRDQLHLCYSQYMLIQTKLKYDVYERAINIFEDVTQCQRDMRKLQQMLREETEVKKPEKSGDENDSDDDDKEEAFDQTSRFMATEIPWLMYDALVWISDKMEKKRKDHIWIENFLQLSGKFDVFQEY